MTSASHSANERRLFFIAEFACIHEGDRDYLLKLAREVREAGADAVKFQAFAPDEVVAPDHPDYEYLCGITFSAEEWLDRLVSVLEADAEACCACPDRYELQGGERRYITADPKNL